MSQNSSPIKYTKVFFRLLDAFISKKYTIYGLQGGTSSSKTYSTIQFLVMLAEMDKKPTLTSIVSESVPHLKRGVLRDFFAIMDSSECDNNYNITNMVYTFPNGSKIEFFSADDPAKLRGARRDRLYLNESNNMNYSAYTQLQIRTKRFTILDWNPESKFWFHNKLQKNNSVWFDISTHFDNPYLDNAIRKSIEEKKESDPEWYRVYGEGLIGQYEGIVFRNTKIYDLSQIFPTIDKIYCGLDFGYFPDPAAFLVVGLYNNKIFIFKEVVSNKLDNKELAELIKPLCKDGIVWCDSASPKDIVELKKEGVKARSVGRKDRQFEINWLKGKEIHIDISCKNTQNEIENFCRKKDRMGVFIPIFEDTMPDHCIDALRYALSVIINNRGISKNLHLGGI